MNKIFNTYLSFLSILVLTGVANLHANVATGEDYHIENFETFESTTNQISIASMEKEVHFDASKQENQENFPAEIIEIELEEEETSEDDLFSSKLIQSVLFNTQIFDYLSFQQQKVLIRCKNYFYIPSTKINVRFQVFII